MIFCRLKQDEMIQRHLLVKETNNTAHCLLGGSYVAKDFLPSENKALSEKPASLETAIASDDKTLSEDYLSVDDIARELDVTTRTVRNYLRRGLLKGHKISNKWWFSKEDLYDLIGNLAVDQTMTITVNDFLLSEETKKTKAVLIIKYPIADLQKNELVINRILKEFNDLKESLEKDTDEFYYRMVGKYSGQVMLKGTVSFVTSFAQFIEAEILTINSSKKEVE